MATVADIALTALRASAGVSVGDAQARIGTEQLTDRYAVLWPAPESRDHDQPITDPNADRRIQLQVTSVGPSRKAVEQIYLATRAIMLGALPTPTGYQWRCPAEHVVGNPIARDKPEDPANPDAAPFYRTDIYVFYITPE